MKSKHKRYIAAPILFVVAAFVFAIASGMAYGFGVGLAGGSSAGAIYWTGAAIIISPLFYLFNKELLTWTRNYNVEDVTVDQPEVTSTSNQSEPSD